MTQSRDYYRMLPTQTLLEEAALIVNDEMAFALLDRLRDLGGNFSYENKLDKARSDLATAQRTIARMDAHIARLTKEIPHV